MAQRWRSAVRKLVPVFFSYEQARAIEAQIPGSDLEAVANSEEHPLKLARHLKWLVGSDDVDKLEERLCRAWEREKQLSVDESFYPEYSRKPAAAVQDMSDLLLWLPREDNPESLGRSGSSRVSRIHASLADIGVADFPRFWADNKDTILKSIPVANLKQRATLETDKEKKAESYSWQQAFLSRLTEGIARARELPVEIGVGVKGAEDAVYEEGYSRRPDSFVMVGDVLGSIEQKTRGSDALKIAAARGQVVILGNIFIRRKSRTVPVDRLESEMFGFVGDGVQLQCVRQVHAFKKKVRTFDGRMLPLAAGDIPAGELFTIDLNSEAVVWAAAALDRMVVSGATKLAAAAGVRNDHVHLGDYGQLKLRATSGYRIGDEYVAIDGGKPADDLMVTVLGAARNCEMSVVLRVLWKSEIWWLKMGPEAGTRREALQAVDELPAGAWERWFQTERDMLARSRLLGGCSVAFAVAGEAASSRAAMLVRDAGESLEKRLLATQKMEPGQVYEMSKQVYSALEAGARQGVVHGDICLENICEQNGSYSLIDWGLACGRPFEELVSAVGRVWPALDALNQIPGVPNWEMSPDCCFLGVRPSRLEHDLESLLYCCMKLLGGNKLPWSSAAVSGTELEVLRVRDATVKSFVSDHQRFIYRPLLCRLGLLPSPPEYKAIGRPGGISAPAAPEWEISA